MVIELRFHVKCFPTEFTLILGFIILVFVIPSNVHFSVGFSGEVPVTEMTFKLFFQMESCMGLEGPGILENFFAGTSILQNNLAHKRVSNFMSCEEVLVEFPTVLVLPITSFFCALALALSFVDAFDVVLQPFLIYIGFKALSTGVAAT